MKAVSVKDNPIVHVSSINRGEEWERPNAGDFTVNVTGSSSVTLGFDTFVLRGKPTELNKSVDDPRQGILSFAGVVTLSPTSVTDIFVEKALDSGSSDDMTVDGSVTPVEFFIDAHPTKQKIIQYLTFSGTANGIKYQQFLNLNSKLTNGITVSYKSQDVSASFDESIDSTDDFEDSFCVLPNDFSLSVQAGGDHFNGTRNLVNNVIILDPQGSYASDDFLKITISDDLTSVNELSLRAKGFLRDV